MRILSTSLLMIATTIPFFLGTDYVAADGHKPDAGSLEGASITILPPEGIRSVLSGRQWLISNSMDPTVAIGGPTGITPAGGINKGTSGTQLQAPGASLVPFRDPSQKFSRNILISRDLSQFPFQTEPHLAVDPRDPDHIIVGLIDYNFPNLTSYVTIDGGVTWEGPFQVKFPREDLGAAGDPVLGFDQSGTPYYAYISLDSEDFQIGPATGQATVSNISISTSEDGGFSWTSSRVAARSKVETSLTSILGRARGEIVIEFLDKPWMAIGPHYEDPKQDIIYITYTKFISTYQLFYTDELPFLGNEVTETVIEVIRSEDQGVTWTDPIAASPRVRSGPPIGISDRVVQGSRPGIAPDGTLYVTWLDTTQDGPFEGLAELYVSRSVNGGSDFSEPIHASTFIEPHFAPRTNFFRMWGTAFPRIAVGPDGNVYIVATSIPASNLEDEGDIFLVVSRDQGESWSKQIRINDDPTGRLQFFPEITVDPEGTLHVMWGDMRDDYFDSSYNIYYSSSVDESATWSANSRVTDFPTNPNMAFPSGRFIGDYFGIAATKEDVYMVWADGRLGELGPPNQKIGFARQRLMPAPSIFLSPSSGPAGRDIVIQGSNFQPSRNLFIEIAGVVVSTDRTNAQGRFSSRIFVPISGEGIHDIRVFDESGNIGQASFLTTFGFDNVKEGLASLANQGQDITQEMAETKSHLATQLEVNQFKLEATITDLEIEVNQLREQQQSETVTATRTLVAIILVGALVLASGLTRLIIYRTRHARV